MKKNKCIAAALLVAAVCTLQADARAQVAAAGAPLDETGLMFMGEELYTVSIASRKAEPLRRAPAAVTVIQGEDLNRYRTLADVLRHMPGFFVERNEVKDRIFLRGIPDSFLVLMDGVPFASDASTRDYPRGMDLSLEYIEKIEVIRGPGSALWGPDAFSGVVNLVTKKGEKLQGGQVSAEVGSDDTRGANMQCGYAKNGWDSYLFGSSSQSHGFEKDLPGSQRLDDRYGEVYGKVSYKDIFEISGRYSKYRDYYTEPSFLLEGQESKPISFVQATLNKSFAKSSVSLQGWYQFFNSLEDYDPSRYRQQNNQFGAELKYDQTLFESNFATFGASFRYNDGSRTKLRTNGEESTYFPSYYTRRYSLYFQDKWKLTDNLETTFGLRWDNHSIYERFFSPRFGINYLFLEYFDVKLLYGRAFRTPSLAVVIEQPGLKPEQIDSYEIELGYHYRNLFGIELNFFYNTLKDLIERNALGEISNKGSDRVKGFELSVTSSPVKNVSLYGNYSRLFGKRQKGASATTVTPNPDDPNKTIENTIESFYSVAPDHIVNCGIEYSFLRHFRANLEMNFVDQRKLGQTSTKNTKSTTNTTHTSLGSYATFDANLFITGLPLKNMELALKLRNLFDRQYTTRGVFGNLESEGSKAYFIIKYKF
jgi:outer membrane receptor protein involved in Fe transport